jgi:phage terminase small subunit
MKPLGPKQARFVEEYLVDLNATQAAIRAGYASKNADVTGPRLLGNVGIASAVAHAQEKRSERLEITLDKWLRELAVIGFSDLANYIEIYEGGLIIAKEFAEMPENSSRALESIEENRTIKESSDGSDSNIINSKIRFKGSSRRSSSTQGRMARLFPSSSSCLDPGRSPIKSDRLSSQRPPTVIPCRA